MICTICILCFLYIAEDVKNHPSSLALISSGNKELDIHTKSDNMCIIPFKRYVMKKRTNIVIDEDLIQAGLKTTGLKTRKELIDYALRDLLRRESQKKILALKDSIHWEGDLTSMRQGRQFE